MLELLQELNYRDFVGLHKDINKLFPEFPARVQRLKDRGGARLYFISPKQWTFKVASGTRNTSYDVIVAFFGVTKIIRDFVGDIKNWESDYSGVDREALANEVIQGADLKITCNDPCLVGSTKIPLLDGRELSIVEIWEQFGESEFWVYSCDEKGDMVPQKARCLGITNEVMELVRVTLDNGADVTCTLNHPFMLRDGTYKKAISLVPGESLMPFYFDKRTQKVLRNQAMQNHKVVKVGKLNVEETPVYDLKLEGYPNFALSAGVYVHNSDLYWGFHYIRSVHKAKHTKPERRPPDIRNPDRRGFLCKHASLVLDELPEYKTEMMNYLDDFYGGVILRAEIEVSDKREEVLADADVLAEED